MFSHREYPPLLKPEEEQWKEEQWHKEEEEEDQEAEGLMLIHVAWAPSSWVLS